VVHAYASSSDSWCLYQNKNQLFGAFLLFFSCRFKISRYLFVTSLHPLIYVFFPALPVCSYLYYHALCYLSVFLPPPRLHYCLKVLISAEYFLHSSLSIPGHVS